MTSRTFKLLSAALLTFAVAGCATQPERIADTPSGWPQITIASSDTSFIQNWIINRNTNKGWSLDNQAANSLQFSQIADTSSFKTVLLQAMIGNSYSTTPKVEAKYTMSTFDQSTTVVVHTAISTQMATGQVNRLDLKGNNTVFNAVQKQLTALKAAAEKRTQSSTSQL